MVYWLLISKSQPERCIKIENENQEVKERGMASSPVRADIPRQDAMVKTLRVEVFMKVVWRYEGIFVLMGFWKWENIIS